MFCRSLFDSDYPFGIFKLFLINSQWNETLNLFVHFVFQEARIKSLEDTCEVDIELNKRVGRIKIRGLPENLSEAVGDVHKIILDVARQKQKHQHAQLVKDMVQWYFISVEDTGQTLEEYPAEVNLTLEQALKNNEPQAFFLDNNGNKYIVDFTTYEEYPEDDHSDTVAVLRKSKMTGETIYCIILVWSKILSSCTSILVI
jgi:hypothetical protein